MKKGMRLLASAIAMTALLLPATARGEDVPCVVVVNKEGKTVATPMSEMSRLSFGSTEFTVSDKQGGSQSYAYKGVEKIEIGKLASGVMQHLSEARFAVWPTVAHDRINVAGSDMAHGIDIYSVSGNLMFHLPISSDSFSIDISGFTPGQYIVKAGNSTVKIIKK